MNYLKPLLLITALASILMGCSGDTSSGSGNSTTLNRGDGALTSSQPSPAATSSSSAAGASTPAVSVTSGCDTTTTPSATPSATPSTTPSASPLASEQKFGGSTDMRRACATSSSDSYEAYVDRYPDLLAAYNASGGVQTKSAWGQAHYTTRGQREGRTLSGSSGSSTKTTSNTKATSSIISSTTSAPESLSEPAFVILSPKAGDRWDVTKPLTIKWRSNRPEVKYVDFRFRRGGGSRIERIDWIANDGHHTWGPPERWWGYTGAIFIEIEAVSPPSDLNAFSGQFEAYCGDPSAAINACAGGYNSSSSSSSSGSNSSSSASGNSSSSSSTTYCTDASVSWPSIVRVGSTITVSWSLRPSGCTVRTNSSVAPTARNFAGSSSGSSASVSSGSTRLSLPCSGGVDTGIFGHSRNRMYFDFSGLGRALGNGKSYSSYAEMTGRC